MRKNKINCAETYLRALDSDVVVQAVRLLSATVEASSDRKGGVLAIAVVYNSTEYLIASRNFGDLGPNFVRYAFNAHEKIRRLYERRQEGAQEIAASQSADADKKQYAGCVVFSDEGSQVFISFSGAPPQVDEAIVFALGEKLGLPAPPYENPLVEQARDLLEGVV